MLLSTLFSAATLAVCVTAAALPLAGNDITLPRRNPTVVTGLLPRGDDEGYGDTRDKMRKIPRGDDEGYGDTRDKMRKIPRGDDDEGYGDEDDKMRKHPRGDDEGYGDERDE